MYYVNAKKLEAYENERFILNVLEREREGFIHKVVFMMINIYSTLIDRRIKSLIIL